MTSHTHLPSAPVAIFSSSDFRRRRRGLLLQLSATHRPHRPSPSDCRLLGSIHVIRPPKKFEVRTTYCPVPTLAVFAHPPAYILPRAACCVLRAASMPFLSRLPCLCLSMMQPWPHQQQGHCPPSRDEEAAAGDDDREKKNLVPPSPCIGFRDGRVGRISRMPSVQLDLGCARNSLHLPKDKKKRTIVVARKKILAAPIFPLFSFPDAAGCSMCHLATGVVSAGGDHFILLYELAVTSLQLTGTSAQNSAVVTPGESALLGLQTRYNPTRSQHSS